jgi:hypothetical protein
MQNTQSPSRSVSNRLRYVIVATVVFLFSVFASLSVMIGYVASKLPPHSSPNVFLHPTTIFSPFTLRRGNFSQAAVDRLQIPVYAGAIAKELSTFGWVLDYPPASATSAGLVLLRVEIDRPVATLDSWYQENFPKPYSHLRGQQIVGGVAKERWFQKLDAHINDETTLYQTNDSTRVRGVIVESLGDSSRTGVTVFYYSEGR